jgi:hypothetical protein
MNISHIVSAAVFASMLGAPGMVLAQQSAPATTSQTASAEATGYLELGDMDVVNPAGEKIGEVEEVLISTFRNGSYRDPGWYRDHVTMAVTRVPSKAFPRRRAL